MDLANSEVIPALHLDAVAKHFGKTGALSATSLRVPRGSVVGLLGPNGAGKTTLMEMICGLTRPLSGDLEVMGAPVNGSPGSLRRVAYVAQEHPLYLGFTTADTIKFGRRMNQNFATDRTRDRLQSLRIPLDERIGRLSGGQRAQVAITLALCKGADLFVLDEPLANLDPVARQDVTSELMAHVADTNCTAIISSHVIDDMADVCDRVALFKQGVLRLYGPVDEIVASHAVLTGDVSALDSSDLDGMTVVASQSIVREARVVVRTNGLSPGPQWVSA